MVLSINQWKIYHVVSQVDLLFSLFMIFDTAEVDTPNCRAASASPKISVFT